MPKAVQKDYEKYSSNPKLFSVAVPAVSTVIVIVMLALFGIRRVSEFLNGAGISSVVSIPLTISITAWLDRCLKGANKTYPAHFKSGVTISRRMVNGRVLNPRKFKSFPLVEKHRLSSDTYRYVFGLHTSDSILGLPTRQHIYIRHESEGGRVVSRSYTLVSSNSSRGHMELVVKTYENGFMSQYLASLHIDERADFREPAGKMKYTCYITKWA